MSRPNKIRLVLFLLSFAAILVYPVCKIWQFEFPSENATVYLFRTEIRDPYDPMRGRYVTLSFGQQKAPLNDDDFRRGKTYFGVLATGKDGFAAVECIVPESKLPPGRDTIRLPYVLGGWKNEKDAHYELPFNRFYLNEKLAPEAEELVKNATRKKTAAVKVRVYANGDWILEDLLIEGRPIREILRENK